MKSHCQAQLNCVFSSISLLPETLDCPLIEVECIAACVCLCPDLHALFVVSVVFFMHILSEGPFIKRTCVLGPWSVPKTGLFMLHLGFNRFPFTPSLPTGGRRDRHQVSAVNDNICAAVAF